jgi:hypothetical protein
MLRMHGVALPNLHGVHMPNLTIFEVLTALLLEDGVFLKTTLSGFQYFEGTTIL